MAEMGTFYDPTIICNLSDEYIKEREARLASLGYSDDEQAVKWRTAIAYADERSPEHALHQRQALAKAAEAGVKLLIGSDSMPIGEIGWLEMEQFVLSGVSEMDTLIAATRNPAELLGVLDSLGTVEEGKLADLVVMADNPLENISNIRNHHNGVQGRNFRAHGTGARHPALLRLLRLPGAAAVLPGALRSRLRFRPRRQSVR